MAESPRPRFGASRQTSMPWAGILAALAALAIGFSGPWRDIERYAFDRLMVATAPNKATLPITIVGIDEPSFAKLKLQWPWPRSLHAKVLDNLRKAGVVVVAFDVVFAERGSKAGDAAFARAIHRDGSVVLASDLYYQETGTVREWKRVDPIKRFTDAGALDGFASVQIEPDGILRRVTTHPESFWSRIRSLLDRKLPGVASRLQASDHDYIRYVGGPHTFPYISYYRLLDPDKYLAPGWQNALKDNVVIIGRDLKATTNVGSAQSDLFQTPFFRVDHQLMPGAEIQANQLATMITGDPIRVAPRPWPVSAWLLASILSILLMRRWRPLRSSLAGIGLIGGLSIAEYALFAWANIWLPLLAAMLAVTLVYLAQGGEAYLLEYRQKRQIRNAFEKYVSPEIVEQVIAHPERLGLGGERRELTVLFTDLANFTALSESMDATRVAQLLNRHLNDITEVIRQHRGTVDKFIGDAVMAFWGAPLEDQDQSIHAVRAAMAMVEKVSALQRELAAAGGPEIRIRIGIHRGECIVGNMGGDHRFDYTAIGDTINLASRMEGVNKLYGTSILMTDTVAQTLEDRIALREVDTVRVKGRQAATTIFTPCGDEQLILLSKPALAAYRSGDWKSATQYWQSVLQYRKNDTVASMFIERIDALQKDLSGNWDGITQLDSK